MYQQKIVNVEVLIPEEDILNYDGSFEPVVSRRIDINLGAYSNISAGIKAQDSDEDEDEDEEGEEDVNHDADSSETEVVLGDDDAGDPAAAPNEMGNNTDDDSDAVDNEDKDGEVAGMAITDNELGFDASRFADPEEEATESEDDVIKYVPDKAEKGGGDNEGSGRLADGTTAEQRDNQGKVEPSQVIDEEFMPEDDSNATTGTDSEPIIP